MMIINPFIHIIILISPCRFIILSSSIAGILTFIYYARKGSKRPNPCASCPPRMCAAGTMMQRVHVTSPVVVCGRDGDAARARHLPNGYMGRGRTQPRGR